ncbi:hypothetical protein Ae201684P_003308 [Aphanomyces euteiches]|uniref:RING-type domain-containing protein n=1 Tax=Aphanomyces euteiches TaxID=100861 RepID=A0A6G0X2M8_9STRA|nr:hypothetical protein Ae201684_009006 [Aphanomyces euteiches]KAH9073806.1 hypothetical protein Ae201684P_003308 [Aphanomyces euteiches]
MNSQWHKHLVAFLSLPFPQKRLDADKESVRQERAKLFQRFIHDLVDFYTNVASSIDGLSPAVSRKEVKMITLVESFLEVPSVRAPLLPQLFQDTCTICLNDLNVSTAVLPCGHCFHRDCVRTWIGNVRKCPLCRQSTSSVTKDGIVIPLVLSRSAASVPTTTPTSRALLHTG